MKNQTLFNDGWGGGNWKISILNLFLENSYFL